MLISSKHITHRWLRSNINGLLIGIVVGLAINFFTNILKPYHIEWQNVALTMMFSILISLSISNFICFAEYIFSQKVKKIWVAVIAYYGGCIFGMTFGHEVSYWLVSKFFNEPYHFLEHSDQLGSSLAISVIVCTILFTYEHQKGRYNARLQSQELEVLKLKQLKTQAELQTLQSKINPHFLYNALNSIAGLIRLDADKAEDMTLKLSRLFRYSMNSQHENFASIRDELEIVNTYMDIENVRFGDRIHFKVEAPEDLMDQKMPRFLIQPLVENALKHGLNNTVSNGRLQVSLNRNHSKLILSVADNGQSFPAELNAGYGLQSTYDKLELLYQGDYDVQLINSPEKQIRITFPIIH